MRIVPIPCLQDNYAYLVVCEKTNQAAIVDPSEAKPVLAAIEREQVTPVAIWTTHHHWDHTGGNDGLCDAIEGLQVIGHASDEGRIPRLTRKVNEGDVVSVGDEVKAEVIHNPGHTTGAISFFLPSAPAVFTGDTLFLSGCGRLFEGDPPMMHASLSKLAALPDDTRVYCGHEYTAANLKFARAVEPDNADIASRADHIAATDGPSVPGTIADEKRTNPFIRVTAPAVIAAAKQRGADGDDPATVLGAIRAWKDSF